MALPQDPTSSFLWGEGGAALTPEQIAQLRAIQMRGKGGIDTSPVGHWTQGAARIVDALGDVIQGQRLNKAEASNNDYNKTLLQTIMGGDESASAIPSPGAAAQVNATSPSAIQQGLAADPVQGVMDAAASPASSGPVDWLKYGNTHATRNQPLSDKLVNALGFLPQLGVTAEVFSGGQPEAGEGPRTGSVRHDHGNAADVNFYKDGRKLDWANDADRPIFEQIVERGKQNGITGFGAGHGYMTPGSMHLGFGTPSVWGAGGKSANAPEWLRNAYAASPSATPVAAPMPVETAALGPIDPSAVPVPTPSPLDQQPPIQAVPDPALAAAPVAPQVSPQSQQVAQAILSQPQPQQVPQAPQTNKRLLAILADPRANEGTKRLASAMMQQQQARNQAILEQQLKQSDPKYKQDLQKGALEIENLRNPKMSPAEQANIELTKDKNVSDKLIANDRLKLDWEKFRAEAERGQWDKMTDGRIFNKTTGEFRDAPPPKPGNIALKPDDISGIRKEIQQLPSYKNIAQAAPIYKSMVETAGRDSKASDLNLVYGLGKIMDPNSVVREGEMVLVQNTSSLPDWLQGAIASVSGGAALTPQTRQNIMTEAYGRVNGYNDEFKRNIAQYEGIAQRNGINRDDIIPQIDQFEPWKAAPQSAPGGQQKTSKGIPWSLEP